MRTVQQRKVYGKRKTNAPRAVLENGSPVQSPSDESESESQSQSLPLNQPTEQTTTEDIVKEIEIQVARIAIEDVSSIKHEIEEAPLPAKSPAPRQYRTSIRTPTSIRQANRPQELLSTPAGCDQSIQPSASSSTPSNPRSQRRLSFTPRQPRAKPARPARPATRLSSGCVGDEKVNAYVRQILDEASSQLAARGVQKFSSWAARSESAFDPVKIAEGSYGEVYKLLLKEDVCKRNMSKSRLAKFRAYGEGVFKVVPLRAQKGPGSKKFTSIDEIAAEVKLLKLLDSIPGFARFREVHVVQGRFPSSFQIAWDTYKDTNDDCMNPNPANKRAYNNNQLWAILEMDDAGVELEKFSWSSVFQVYDIFWGVAMGLARAEEFALFEHRDLHLGNICLRSIRNDGDMQSLATLNEKQLEKSSGFGISSLETTIIDYSLSRAELRLTDDPDETVEIASSDLDSKQIFDAVGRDEDEILLRNTYRYMRGQLYTGNPLVLEKQRNIQGIWAEYAPRTNLIWLLFILKNLVKNMEHKDYTLHTSNTSEKESRQPLQPRPEKANKRQVISSPSSADDSSCSLKCIDDPRMCGSHKKKNDNNIGQSLMRLQASLRDRLTQILEILDLEHGRDDMCCAADLVAYAIDQRWLDESDFFLA